jgi:4TM region of pyridine nucleotide transhydrogenase, mitoch
MDGVALLTMFVLAVFVGYEVISKVSTTLFTPNRLYANDKAVQPRAVPRSANAPSPPSRPGMI